MNNWQIILKSFWGGFCVFLSNFGFCFEYKMSNVIFHLYGEKIWNKLGFIAELKCEKLE